MILMRLALLRLPLLFAVKAYASSGDRAGDYQHCLSKETRSQCSKPQDFPLAMRLTRWTCDDDVKYTCMHFIVDKAMEKGEPLQQYYGKWPFWRWLGMQEPASVLFSWLNLWAHWRGGKSLRRQISKEHPMRPYYIGFNAISMNMWVWSAVFHTKDKPFTEKMDYFSAAAAILCGFFYTIVRLFHLYAPQTSRLTVRRRPRHPLLIPWAILCTLLFLAHITYLSLLPRFDYSYNILANAIVGLSHNLIWASYSLPSPFFYKRFLSLPNSYRPKCVRTPALLAVVMTSATALEIFDFPPWWRVIDAHSLWHLSTVPLVLWWYRFLIEDARDSGWRTGKEEVLMP